MTGAAPIPDGTPYDFSRTGIPWVDTIIDVCVLVGAIVAALYTAWRTVLKPSLTRIEESAKSAAKDAKVAKEEVKNTHSTNLRHDIDRLIGGVEVLTKSVDEQAASLARLEEHQREHGQDIRALSEEQRLATGRMNQLTEDVREVRKNQHSHEVSKAGMEPRLQAVEAELKAHRENTEDPL